MQKPSVMSKASDGATRHSGTRREMLQRDRQLRQKNIEAENHSLVRRLLAVKSSLDSQSFEKDYRRLAPALGLGWAGPCRASLGPGVKQCCRLGTQL